MISFNSIPTDIRLPGSYVEFANDRAQPNLAPWVTRGLIVGQMLAAGSSQPYVKQTITSVDEAYALFGQGSQVAAMVKAWLQCNTATPFDVIGAPDLGGGVKATKTVTVSTAPTSAGTLALYMAGAQVEVGIGADDSVDTVATNIADAINAIPTLPMTAAAAGAVVTATCNWKGLTGNDIDIRANYFSSDVMPEGLSVVVADGVAGAGNPTIAPVIAAWGAKQYHFIACPWTDGASLAALTTEMADRRGPMEMIEGVVFLAAKGSAGTLATLGESQNSQDISIDAAIGPVSTWERAARNAATIALYGSIDPARPFQTLVLAGDPAPNDQEAFIGREREAMLHDGISTSKVVGGQVQIERPITTYQLNAAGYPDTSYLDVNTMLTLGYLRYTLVARIAQKFPRCTLADDGISASASNVNANSDGKVMVTPKVMSAELVALAYEWQDAGLVENVAEFQSLLRVQRNAANRSQLDAYIPPDIVSGLRVFAAQIDFAY